MSDVAVEQDRTPYVWPDEITKRAKALWSIMSAPEISDIIQLEFGVCLTKKQISDKMFKVGVRKVPGRKSGDQAHHEAARIAKPPKEPFVPRVVEVTSRNLPLSDLGPHECRYECSGQDDPKLYTFCGNPTRDKRCSYCAPHAALAYRPFVEKESA